MTYLPNGPKRIVIYVKDVMILTGRKETAARWLYKTILVINGKLPGDYVTVQEFCAYMKMNEEVVYKLLNA